MEEGLILVMSMLIGIGNFKEEHDCLRISFDLDVFSPFDLIYMKKNSFPSLFALIW
jgi:hypothetical protein